MPIRARLPYDAKVIEPDRFISEVWKNYLVSLEQDADTGFVQSVTGTANRITITGTATDPIVDISSAYDAAITAQIAAYAQPLDGDLTAIAALTGTGFLKKTAPNTWALDASVLGTTLTDSHIFVGNALNIAADVAMSGDATLANTGALTLATVATAGTTGGSTAIPVITIDAKGRTTSITTAAVVAPAGTLTGTTLAANVVSSSLTSVGTLVSGTWNAATIAIGYGGTGLTGVGTANQSFGTNAAANGFEHKAMTVTSAGAVAGVTTLNASGDITTTAGSIYLAPYPKGIFGYGESTSIITWDASNIYMNFQGSRTGIIMYGGSSGSFTWGINLGTYMTLNTTALTVNTNITGNFITANSGIQTSSLYATDNVSIGAAVNDAYAFNVEGSLTSSASQVGGRIDVTASSAATTFGRGLYVRMSTAAAAYTMTEMNVIEAAEPSVGAGSSITDLRLMYINATAAVATNKYGLYIETMAGGVSINRAIRTGPAGDVLFGYLAGTGTRMVTASATGVLGTSTATFPLTATAGDIIYASASNTWTTLAANGTATNKFLTQVSGGAPAWNAIVTGDINALVNTWSGIQTVSASGAGSSSGFAATSANPSYGWNETDQAADGRQWDASVDAGVWALRVLNDAGGTIRNAIAVTRSSAAISSIDFGNASNNPTGQWLGTGSFQYNGGLTVIGTLSGGIANFSGSVTLTGTDRSLVLNGTGSFLSIGGAPNQNSVIEIKAAHVGLVGSQQFGITVNNTFNSSATSGSASSSARFLPATQAAAFTMPLLNTVLIGNVTVGGGSAVTTQVGLKINDLTSGGTNWSIQAGTAQSYHVGNFRIGSTSAPTVALDVTGAALVSSTLGVTGATTLTNLAGTGSRMVIASAAGLLSAPALSSAYSITNVTTDRAYNANSTSIDELADVLGTLIADLQAGKLPG
jgi:hypothetical protein